MKKAANKYFISFVSIILIGLYFNSCYKKVDGCTDPNAMDYEVDADEMCEDECCDYPDLSLNIKLISDSTKIDTNTLLTDDFGNEFIIKFCRIYFSDFKFYDINGGENPLKNNFIYYENENNEIKTREINFSMIKYRPEAENYKIGEILDREIYNRMDFNFGINPEINHSLVDKLTISSPLYPGKDSLHISSSEGFYFLKMSINKPDGDNIRSIEIKGDENFKPISIIDSYDFTSRENHILYFNIDQKTLFNTIDVISDDDNSFKEKILHNLASSIRKG